MLASIGGVDTLIRDHLTGLLMRIHAFCSYSEASKGMAVCGVYQLVLLLVATLDVRSIERGVFMLVNKWDAIK